MSDPPSSDRSSDDTLDANAELDEFLARLEVPVVRPEKREESLRLAALAFEPRASAAPRRRTTGWSPAAAALILGLALAFVFVSRPTPEEASPGSTDASWTAFVRKQEEIYRELADTFPGRLRAWVDASGDSRVELSPEPRDYGRPVLVRICAPEGGCAQVISYSGQSVSVRLGERRLQFEVLLTGEGEVLLFGPGFVWNDAGAPDLSIRSEVIDG